MQHYNYYMDMIEDLGHYRLKSKDFYSIPADKLNQQFKELISSNKISAYYCSQQFYYYISSTLRCI